MEKKYFDTKKGSVEEKINTIASEQPTINATYTPDVKLSTEKKYFETKKGSIEELAGKLIESKLDPVDKDAVKKKFDDRKDKDIDNDGDTTSTSGAANGSIMDDHSVTVSSDELGTLKFSAEGGSSATTAMDASAAGNVWDTFDGSRGTIVTAVAQSDSAPGDNSFLYTLPEVMDGLSIDLSYKPQGSNALSASGYGISYTGVEGLTAKYSSTEIETGATGTSGDHTAWHLSYVYGPVTGTVTNSEYDVGTAASDQTLSSFAISYTISDELSVTYGEDTIEKGGDPTDAEYSVISASYTAGGMTLSASMKEAENTNHTTASNEDFEYWSLGASFAF
jgi:outer membrane protein OmpU